MSRLLIDGYNLLYTAGRGAGPPGEAELRELLESLRRYKKLKGHAITLVLDGYAHGMPVERSERVQGIGVVYSRLGEKADQVIERMARQWGGACVVVTSDREVALSVEQAGAVAVGSEEFLERLRLAQYLEQKGEGGPEEGGGRLDTRKKGNPRRRSKKERLRRGRLKKL